ncbi:atlastin-like isoform X2 [Zophobas morio]|uniref:atlastin-like isoform X2 n=1 Tax=Zophobas morio TaxID=2755281 RepID=UPI0030835649
MEHPHPLQLFEADQNNKIILNPDVLKILKSANIKNKKVCVYSIAGAFREGKSFLLNFLVHYFKNENEENWLQTKKTLTKAFPFRPGFERETVGVLMWSEIFTTKRANGDEVAVIILDTQGTFDHKTASAEYTAFFALSVLVSSVQMYNLKDEINMDHLKALQLFSGYGKMFTNSSSEQPFQKLVFVVRDWKYDHEYPLGAEGGTKYLETVFKKQKLSNKEELLEIQQSIEENFEEVKCFVLPHPGKAVTGVDFQGHFKDVSKDFLKHAQDLVETLVSPQNLVVKNVNNEEISAEGLANLLETLSLSFEDGKRPDVADIFIVVAEFHWDVLTTKCVTMYKELLKNCKSEKQAEQNKQKVLEEFQKSRKMGNKLLQRVKENQLINELEELFQEYQNNQSFLGKMATDARIYVMAAVVLITSINYRKWTKVLLKNTLNINKKYFKKMVVDTLSQVIANVIDSFGKTEKRKKKSVRKSSDEDEETTKSDKRKKKSSKKKSDRDEENTVLQNKEEKIGGRGGLMSQSLKFLQVDDLINFLRMLSKA